MSFSFCSSSLNSLLDILSAFKGKIYGVKFFLTCGISDESLDMTLPVEFGCQNMTRKLAMMGVEGLVSDVLIGSIQFLPYFPRSAVANIMQKSVRLQRLFGAVVRESRSEMRRMTNDFKALVMNADKLMVIISLRWKSPSSTFIRLCEHFILIMPRFDIVLSIGLTWLYLERCDQAARAACLLKAKQAKCLDLEDWRNLNEF